MTVLVGERLEIGPGESVERTAARVRALARRARAGRLDPGDGRSAAALPGGRSGRGRVPGVVPTLRRLRPRHARLADRRLRPRPRPCAVPGRQPRAPRRGSRPPRGAWTSTGPGRPSCSGAAASSGSGSCPASWRPPSRGPSCSASPAPGSDLPSLSTRADRDGDEWVVTGQKVWSSYAGWSTFGMLLARTDPDAPKRRGITYFVIEMDQPGIEARPLVQMTGDAEFFEVFLDEARVADANRLGPVGRGWDVARTTLAGERRAGTDGGSPGSTRSLGGLIDSQRDAAGRVAGPLRRQRLAALSAQRSVNSWTVQRLAPAARGRDVAELGRQAGRFGVHDGPAHARGSTWPARTAPPATRPTTTSLRTRHDFLGTPSERIAGGSDEIQRNTLGENVLGLPREPDALSRQTLERDPSLVNPARRPPRLRALADLGRLRGQTSSTGRPRASRPPWTSVSSGVNGWNFAARMSR